MHKIVQDIAISLEKELIKIKKQLTNVLGNQLIKEMRMDNLVQEIAMRMEQELKKIQKWHLNIIN